MALLDDVREIVGERGLIDDPEKRAHHLVDWRDFFHGEAGAIVQPGTTEEVAAVVRLCAATGVPIVPQGGNTGLVGGGIPADDGRALLLSLSRLNRIREIDLEASTMTVEAGCILADIQTAASDNDRLFPLSLGAEGTCQIGGNIATNAGGINVVRYGNTRDLVLGLEVVLPDGRVWSGLRGLKKDNAGYALKHLFIGSEGTLGIITAAILQLFPRPKDQAVALAGIQQPAQALALLDLARQHVGERVQACELICRASMAFAFDYVSGTRDPLAQAHPFYVILELADARPDAGMRELLERVLEEAFERALIADAVLAASESQRAEIWRLREAIVEGARLRGLQIKHDVSLPLAKLPAFLERAERIVADIAPECVFNPFGHVGDGNLHVNVSVPEGMTRDAFLTLNTEVNDAVHALVHDMGGSIAAEHGIGQLKAAKLARYKSAEELGLMRAVKRAIDPQGLMNPGKVLV